MLAIVRPILRGAQMQNKVSRSIEAPGGAICVDLFQRPDGSWGCEEYRRDAEDGQGWYMTGFLGDLRYRTEADALKAALDAVPWLRDALNAGHSA